MKELKFNFFGQVHYADYSLYYRSYPSEVVAFIVYPRNQEIQYMIGTSKTFLFHKNSDKGITYDCPDKSAMTKKLCETIADALCQNEKFKNTSEKSN